MDSENKQSHLNIDSSHYITRLSRKYTERKKYQPADPKQILSLIPGVVIEVFVSTGMEVKKGQDLMTIDAMKMKNRIRSSMDGRVKAVNVNPGTKVGKGTMLLELE